MADRAIVIATLALAGAYLYATQQLRVFAFGDPVGPRAFPQLLVAGLLLAAVMLVIEVRARRPGTGAGPREDRRAMAVVAGTAALMAAYFALFVPLGYVVATSAFLLITTASFRHGRWTSNALVSVGFGLVTYLAFTRVLGASLPPGVLPF